MALYSNITHDLGIQALNYWLNKTQNEDIDRISKEFIVKGMEIILQNNYMYFDGEIYRQIRGTAMGTRVAPVYANLVLAYLEDQLFGNLQETFDLETTHHIMEYLKRFLDDLFLIWKGTDEELQKLYRLMNTMDEDLKFTMEVSDEQIPFLDVLVIKHDNKIETDIYSKPTDTKQYLTFHSCHPRHVKVNLPYNLARRLVCIVSNEEIRQKRFDELHNTLKSRGYPNKIIDDAVKKAKGLNRTEILNHNVVHKKDHDVLPYVSTFNPRNPELFPTIKSNIEMLKNDKKMKSIIEKKTLIKSKRQPQNLKNILSSSRYDSTKKTGSQLAKCENKRCGCCEYIHNKETFNYNGKTLGPRGQSSPLNCASKNLLYGMICGGCQELYIGQTGDTLRARVRVHKQQIRDARYRMLPVSGHIETCGKGRFSIIPFYKFWPDDGVNKRLILERHFMNIFNPKLNK